TQTTPQPPAPTATTNQSAEHTGPASRGFPGIDPEGTVLVTGATGGLGGPLTRHLVGELGARHLVLAGRRGPDAPGAPELAAELRELGAEVRLAACDVADPESLAALLAEIPDAHPLTMVVHAAGVVSGGIVGSLGTPELHTVLRPKVDAAWNLHEQTKQLGVRSFVLFSSLSSVFGNPGQANYAAANAYLDALAHRRRALGLPAVSLMWGVWETDGGMAELLDGSDRGRMGKAGVVPMSSEVALELFDAALDLDLPVVAPAEIDLSALRGLTRAPARRAGPAEVSWPARLAGLTADEQHRLLLDLVREHVAAVAGHDSAEDIDPDLAFQDLGFNSLTAVELRNQLGEAIGRRLPATMVFDHPTATALAGYLRESLQPKESGGPGRLMADLESLESTLDRLPEQDRQRAAARLRAILWKIDGDVPETDEIDLLSAEDEQLFQVLENELARGGESSR
ncbi:type I polyketide synthase, partial [Nonomuraea zeae]